MRPCRFTVTIRPLFGSSGRACAFGSATSTPPCMIGAVIMKMTIMSIITSMRLTTLISALSGIFSPRRRDTERAPNPWTLRTGGELRASDPALAHHQRDQLRAEALELAVQAVETVREDVVPEDGG